MSDPNAGSKPGYAFRRAHGENAATRSGSDLWGKRRWCSVRWYCHTPANKRLVRRLERRVGRPTDIRDRIAEMDAA